MKTTDNSLYFDICIIYKHQLKQETVPYILENENHFFPRRKMFRMDFPFAPFDAGVDCADPGVTDCVVAAAGLGGGVVCLVFDRDRRPGLRGGSLVPVPAAAAEDRAPGDGGGFEPPLLPLKKPLEDLPVFLPAPDEEDLPNFFLLPILGVLSALLPVTSKPSCTTDPGTGRSGPT